MKVCVPITENRAWDSPVHGHFGSAPSFAVLDTETDALFFLHNHHSGHEHGQCNPLAPIASAGAGAILVAGIGARALLRLNQAGIRVYRCDSQTLREAFDLLKAGALEELGPEGACHGHASGSGCQGA